MLRQQQSPISRDGNGRCWHPCRAFSRRFGGAAFRSIGVYLPEYGFVCTSSNRDSVVAGENDVVLQRIKQQFDGRAALYEKDNTYHPPLAQHLLSLCDLKQGQRLLDLASGTGLVALPAAAAVGPTGLVVAVDISQAMLEQLQDKYSASQLLQEKPQYPEQYSKLAPVQCMIGDMEDLNSCLAGDWRASFEAITCSAAVPFLRDPQAALTQWRQWLSSPTGRLAFNAFVAPAVREYATFITLAKQFGLSDEFDPCERLGSEDRLRDVLQQAGFGTVQITPEQKERWYPATSIEEYAETIWRVALTNNPFADPDRLQLQGDKQQQFHDTYVTAAVESISEEGRYDAASKRILSPYTVLHVLATVE